MNKSVLTVLVILMLSLLVYTPLAMAYDQKNSASYSVVMIVNTSSTFTATIPTGETVLRFNGKQGDININASGQTSKIPWIKINNTGANARNFTIGLDSSPPSGITLMAKNNPNVTRGIVVNNIIKELPGGHLLPGGGKISSILNIWIKANYDMSIPSGTYKRNVAIRNYMPILKNISISGPATIYLGSNGTYIAKGIDQEGNIIPLTGSPTWSVSPTGSGSIDTSGKFSPTKLGIFVITATYSGKTAHKSVSVIEAPIID